MSAIAAQVKATGQGVAVVTGASAGIGRVYADRLARRGYDLILVARRAERLDQLARQFRADYGVGVETLVADLTAPADLDRVAAALAADPRITLLVNNAGSLAVGPVDAVDGAALEAMSLLNITALVRLTRAVLPGFKARKHGTLINIGSVLGFHAIPGTAAYSGTKGYVLNFTRGLQDEVAGTGVVVQLVLPAATATEIWDRGGASLERLDPATVMTAESLVDAALAGLDQGETVTLPSVEDLGLFAAYDAARLKLLGASQTGTPATRYRR